MTGTRVSRGLSWMSRTAPLVAIGVLILALSGQRRALEGYRAREAAIRPALVRIATLDRTLGKRLPDVPLTDPSGHPISLSPGGRGRVVWWIDVKRCVGCLAAHLAEWQVSLRAQGVEGLLVLGGVDRARGMRLVEGAGVREPVALDPRLAVGSGIGGAAAALLLAIDGDGVIVGADALAYGSGESRCGWPAIERMPALVGRLRSGSSATPAER